MTAFSKFHDNIEAVFPEMVALRRRLHQFPELSFQEFETTELLCQKLAELGYEVHRPLETGCIAALTGAIQSNRVVALRADIDALAMDEMGEFKQDFLSQNPGVAHCCGHDVHTANLMGVAQLLASMKSEIDGTVVLVFQPGEEKIPGGGRLISESGILQKLGVQRMYGLHTSPEFAPGQVAVKSGPLMARPDEFRLRINGRGGHAAAPHNAVDPIVIAAQVISSLQAIVSRSIDPTESAVVTVGKINGGTAHNVIPEFVEMLGTIRSFDTETAHKISGKIEAFASGIAAAHGGSAEFRFDEGYPPVINDGQTTERFKELATEILGENAIIELAKPIMAGEDFAFYQQHFPGTFFFLGSGSKETESIYPWHHPRYNADETSMKTGAALMLALALNG